MGMVSAVDPVMAGDHGGLAGAVTRGVLKRGTGGRALPFSPTGLDVELLRAVEAAAASLVPIAIVLPLPGTAAPLLLGAAALIGAVMRERSLTSQAAVVSPHLASRILYDQLFFKDQRLADYIPRTAVSVDGRPRVVGKPRRDAGGRLHLVSDLSRLSGWAACLSGIAVDGAAVAPGELRKFLVTYGTVPLVYLTADPGDPGLEHVREAGGVVWGWDAGSLVAALDRDVPSQYANAGPLVTSAAVLRHASRSEVVVVAPAEGETSTLDTALSALWERIARLSAVSGVESSITQGHGLRWARGLFNTLSMLPISPARYDKHTGHGPYAVRLGEAVSTARALARHTGREAAGHWFGVADALSNAMVAAAREERLTHLIRWAATCVSEGRRSLLLVRNSAARVALIDAMNEALETPLGWDDWVRVATMAELVAGRLDTSDVREIRVPGPLPRARAGLLALPPAPLLSVLTTGPFECQRALRQARWARSVLRSIREETTTCSAPRLSLVTASNRRLPETDVRLLAGEVEVLPMSWPRLPGDTGQWDPFDARIPELLRRVVDERGPGRDEDDAPAPTRVVGGLTQAEVPVLAFELYGGDRDGLLFAAPNDVLTRRRGMELQRVAAKSLLAGDVIFLVDHDARRDLLGAVIGKLSETAMYAPLAVLVDFWHRRARLVARSGMTYRDILRRMHGTSITSEQAIGSWVRGEVNGPQDPADVRRFAIAVQDRVLLAQAERVGWALKTLQIVHRKAGRWLSSQISGADPRPNETLIDVNLGLRVSDLLDSVTAHTVGAVDRSPRTVAAHAVGRLLPRTDE